MNCECEYFNTCSRRGAPKGCQKGDAASFKRCRRAVEKAGLFSGEQEFYEIFQEEIKGRREEGNNKTPNNSDNNSELPPEVNLLPYQSTDDVNKFLKKLYKGGCSIYPARNASDNTIAGYYLEKTPKGRVFVPTADIPELV